MSDVLERVCVDDGRVVLVLEVGAVMVVEVDVVVDGKVRLNVEGGQRRQY